MIDIVLNIGERLVVAGITANQIGNVAGMSITSEIRRAINVDGLPVGVPPIVGDGPRPIRLQGDRLSDPVGEIDCSMTKEACVMLIRCIEGRTDLSGVWSEHITSLVLKLKEAVSCKEKVK